MPLVEGRPVERPETVATAICIGRPPAGTGPRGPTSPAVSSTVSDVKFYGIG